MNVFDVISYTKKSDLVVRKEELKVSVACVLQHGLPACFSALLDETFHLLRTRAGRDHERVGHVDDD